MGQSSHQGTYIHLYNPPLLFPVCEIDNREPMLVSNTDPLIWPLDQLLLLCFYGALDWGPLWQYLIQLAKREQG